MDPLCLQDKLRASQDLKETLTVQSTAFDEPAEEQSLVYYDDPTLEGPPAVIEDSLASTQTLNEADSAETLDQVQDASRGEEASQA